MSTTVTTTTVSLVSSAGLVGALGAILSLTLIVFLLLREVGAAAPSPMVQRTVRAMSVGIVPMLIAFAVLAVDRIAGSF